jgi:hypothetical protein
MRGWLVSENHDFKVCNMSRWLFDDPPNVAVLTTYQVLKGETILYVSHDEEDGSWQFHTGETVNESDAKVVSLKRIVELDCSVMQLADLPLGWVATRLEADAVWQRLKCNKHL